LEHEGENKEKERSDNLAGEHEGVWISQKDYTKTLTWIIYQRDGKPCFKLFWSV